MVQESQLIPSIFQGWEDYQASLIVAIAPLDDDELAFRVSPDLRPVRKIVAHIIGARARWFYKLMGEGGDEFASLATWDHQESKSWNAEELVSGLEATWKGMQAAINRWSAEDWQQTWTREYAGESKTLTRQWVIWHLIEHDLHHGGEVSIILGANGVQGLEL